MNIDTLIDEIKVIQHRYPENLMARYFHESYFRSLDSNEQAGLAQIIRTGIKNPDSHMGAYAMNPTDYDTFSPLLDPMIRNFHKVAAGTDIHQRHDWDTSRISCDLSAIDPILKDVSMRVRVARNVTTFPLPGAMSKEERVAFEALAIDAFDSLISNPAFGGRYLSITPNSSHEINKEEYERRVKTHQMFKDMSSDPYLNAAGISADWPYGRGMYISEDEDFLVWVGEEDHLRIMTMLRGGNLNTLFSRLSRGLETLETLLPPFASSNVYGNVTSCPTNLGTGMRASLHMKLPHLTSNGRDLSLLKQESKALGLAVRGAGGEHSNAGEGGLVDISPTARLGITEHQIMHTLYDGAAKLWAMEKAAH